ncbi:MAG: hypothetical protein A3H91_05535 [Gammaproteobacteria bacterium RIFCSPLOWO2_02_FULL_61_13]|nr:MAG: hypothetical protein A3H91_05535 [Gammaproteobacteria bacterium RIFCSPLOWO2_02_FULL_61_13]
MYESKWVRLVYAIALVWVMFNWASMSYEMVSSIISPKRHSYSPMLIASALLTTAIVLPFCLQRLGVVLRGPGVRRMISPAPMARAARFLGLGVLMVCALMGVLMLGTAVLAAGLRGGGTLILGLAYLKPYFSIVSPLTGILLYETSRLLACESAYAAG